MFFLIPAALAGPLTVDVVGARNDSGTVACQIFTAADGFPETDARAVAYAVAPIRAGVGQCVFAEAPKVPYAIAVIHDENGDLHLGRSRLGLPTEGYAFTNDALGWWGTPPSYDKALVQPGAARHTLHLVY